MGEFASKLLDRIKLPFVVIILAIDLACAGIIFLPEQLREMLYLESFRRNFIQWIGPSFFILTLLLIMYVLLSVFKFVGNFLEAKKFEHAIDHKAPRFPVYYTPLGANYQELACYLDWFLEWYSF